MVRVRVVARYSFARGKEIIERAHPTELAEVIEAISAVNAAEHRTKESRESTMMGKMLYSPKEINSEILDKRLHKPPLSWDSPQRVLSMTYHIEGLGEKRVTFTTDGLKSGVALEVQLGKYAFVEYDICAKLPVYKGKGRIDSAIEVIPMGRFVRQMSTGPGWFERTATILENRGYGDLDVPVLLLGIDADPSDDTPPGLNISRPI